MKDEAFQQQRKRVLDLAARWVKPIGLGWWLVHINFHDHAWSDPNGRADMESCLMDVYVDWRYLEATIRVDATEIADVDDDRLEYAFVHELVHIFVREMRVSYEKGDKLEEWQSQEQIDHEERVCSMLAHALIWTRKAGMEQGLPLDEQLRRNTQPGDIG
jgi:hypothetical protein